MNHIPSGDDRVSKAASVALSFLKKRLTKSKQFRFLDIGCGNGRDIDFISSNLDNLIIRGIDISLKAIENAIELNSNKDNVTFECLDWKDLDDTQYDIIFISGVYHFFNIADRNLFITKIKEILKSHGFFFLNTLSSNDKQYYGKGMPVKDDPNSFQSEFFIHFCSEDELREDFKFLKFVDLFEYFHKNYSKDTEYHTMWILIGKNVNSI
ncbi:MAG: class I SAM-dependent methyltransferase [Candidatus Lokiarchaeota archaeon]|nr:class I SAM-dependent methyltransferase [Candidatus Lokiarchaeota archaeon]